MRDMSNLTMVIESYLEMYRTGDTSCVMDLIDAEHADRTLPHFSGAEGVVRAVARLHSLLADVELRLEQLVLDGDRAAFLVHVEGTREGQRTILRIADFARFKDGKLIELWSVQER
jgi:predicted SnoaL-like aldol condensation-catalyzing enzyme